MDDVKKNFNPFSNVAELHIEVSDSCNLQCGYCYFVSKAKKTTPFPIQAFDHLMELFFRKTDSDVTLVFHGGEPLLADALWLSEACEVAKRHAKENGHDICFHLQTNGTLLSDPQIEELVKNDFSVNVSLDGPKDIHNSIRGGYDATVKSIRRLNEAGILTGVIAVIGKHNFNRIHEVVNELISLNVQRYHFNIGSILNGNNSLIMTENEILTYLKASLHEFEISYIKACNWVLLGKLRRYLSGRIPAFACDSPICGAAIHKMHLKKDGSFYPCGSCVSTREADARFRIGSIADDFDPKSFENMLTDFHHLYFQHRRECEECRGKAVCDFICPAFDEYDPLTLSNKCEAFRQFKDYLDTKGRRLLEQIVDYYGDYD